MRERQEVTSPSPSTRQLTARGGAGRSSAPTASSGASRTSASGLSSAARTSSAAGGPPPPPAPPSSLSTLYPRPTPYTLHPTPYTLHPSPYTLHPAPPIPYTLQHTLREVPPRLYTCHYQSTGVYAESDYYCLNVVRSSPPRFGDRVFILPHCPHTHTLHPPPPSLQPRGRAPVSPPSASHCSNRAKAVPRRARV